MGEEGRIVQIDPSGGVGADAELPGDSLTVEVVPTAAEALEILETADCLVFEPALPNADPVEFCETVRAQFPDLPIIAYPSNGTESLAGELLAAGIDGYVPQSAGVETLIDRIEPLLVDLRRVEPL
ncbi:MAG: response regulator [Natrialbaceae archaeon]|nr:response regulator [Natrialbaceae archaeon]